MCYKGNMKVWIYARVSQDRSGRGRSPKEQAAECQAWADREGWSVDRTIIETGSASRYAKRDRPEWATVTQAIRDGHMDALLTWESSRATRDLAAYADLRDDCATAGVKWGYSGQLHDLSTRDARFRTGLDALMAEDEAARTSERVRRNIAARAQAGLPHGKIPYGYRREYDPQSGALLRQVPDETTAPVMRRIYADCLEGKSCWVIARDLREEGVPTPRPSKWGWRSAQVRWLITSPAYRAARVFRGEVIGDAQWPALVDVDTWWAAQARINDPNKPKRSDTGVVHLLSGIARCGVCDSPMYVQSIRKYQTYVCKYGQHVGRSQRLLDAYVTERLMDALAVVEMGDDKPTSAAADAKRELDALTARLDAFTTSAADGEVSPAALAKIEASLAPKIAAAQTRLAKAATPSALNGYDLSDPQALWETCDLEQRRHLLRTLLDVKVLPCKPGARSIKPGTVAVDLRW